MFYLSYSIVAMCVFNMVSEQAISCPAQVWAACFFEAFMWMLVLHLYP